MSVRDPARFCTSISVHSAVSPLQIRATGTRQNCRNHVAIDDHSRNAFSQNRPDEKASSAIALMSETRPPAAGRISDVRSVIRQNGVDLVWSNVSEIAEEVCCDPARRRAVKLDERELLLGDLLTPDMR